MRKTLITLVTTMVALAAAFCFMPGCEDDADTSGDALDNYFKNNPYVTDPRSSGESVVSITPTEGIVTFQGQQILFQAKGGNPGYSWGTSKGAAAGTITPRAGNSAFAVYTTTTVVPNNVIVNDTDGEAAIADITDERGPLTITPASLTVDNTPPKSYTLIASGGVPPYSWISTDTGLATVTAGGTDDKECTYEVASTNIGGNTLTLQDADSNIKTATITHTE